MNYWTVFDAASAGYGGWKALRIGLILIVGGIVLVGLRRHFPKWFWPERLRRFGGPFAWTFLIGAILWTLFVGFIANGQRNNLIEARASGKVQVVEGSVTSFKPMPAAGHAMESFCVQAKCFEYSDYFVSGGFNNTSSHGGPIKEGLLVRVSYVGNTIVKLEVAR